MKSIVSLAFVAIIFIGCQSKSRIYSENQELSPQMEWLKSDVKTFKVKIDDPKKSYKLSLAFRYAEGYSSKLLKVSVIEISPTKKEKVVKYDLKIINVKGEYIGEPGLDIWDSEHLVEQNKKYQEKGVYTYKIEHQMPSDVVNMAMEIGLIVDAK
jgi:gliding motility-associated lipoprotein GldH